MPGLATPNPNPPPLDIVIGPHLFGPEQLAQLTQAVALIPPGQTGAAVALLDNAGVRVAVEVQNRDGHFRAGAAYAHTWAGDNAIGGHLLYTW